MKAKDLNIILVSTFVMFLETPSARLDLVSRSFDLALNDFMFVSVVDFRRALQCARANAATLGPRG